MMKKKSNISEEIDDKLFEKIKQLVDKKNKLYDESYFEEALAIVDELLELFPKDLETLYNKAICLSKLDREDEALVYYNKVLDKDSGNIDVLHSKGLSVNLQHKVYHFI